MANVPPVDALDACYKKHDLCYEDCRTNNTCSVARGSCFSKCDYASVPCQLQALYGNNYWDGYLQSIPGTIALGGQGVVRDGMNATISAANSAWNATVNGASSAWNATVNGASSTWNAASGAVSSNASWMSY